MASKKQRAAEKSPKPANSSEDALQWRPEIIRALVLAVATILIWCTLYNRWTAESWQTPIAYLTDPQKGDVLSFLAIFKEASHGNVWPVIFTNLPQLGAPHQGNWDDFPMPEMPVFLFTGLLVKIFGLFPGANLSVLVAQILAALAFYAACRLLSTGSSWIWAFAGAIVFAFARYAFSHGLHHLPVTYYWDVPLCLVVCEWMFRGRGIEFGTWQFKFSLAIAAIAGLENPYYLNMFVQLVLLGAALQVWRNGWRACLPAVSICAVSCFMFGLMVVDVPLHHIVAGNSTAAVVRSYHWLEVYGLKLVDLVLPPPDHPLPPFADWSAAHMKDIILAPGEMPPTAYLGLVGIAATVWLFLAAARRAANDGKLPLEAWFLLWIFLYAEVGGLDSIGGLFGIQFFRSSTRYSIFILCIVLMWAVRRLSQERWARGPQGYVTAALLALFALWEQTPPVVTDADLKQVQQEVASDRDFTNRMVATLPPNAMIFQLPIMDYPESPAPGLGSYDHFRPYLFTDTLRFSYGTDKGRPDTEWQHQIGNANLGELVSRLESYGFAALYINLNGFQDHGTVLLKALKDGGLPDGFTSARGDLVCIPLKPSPNRVSPDKL